VSVDSIAGEKERGTLETLLTTAAGRAEIVAGKLLVVLTVMLTITVIQLGNMAAYLWLRVIPLPADFAIDVPPASLAALALLLLPLAGFSSALLLTISGYAKSYKEAQLYFLPVYLLSLLPAAAAALPGLALRSAIVVVPIANVSVAVRDVMMGRRDWLMILAVSAVMSILAALMARSSARLLSAERLIGGGRLEAAEHKGGPALFPYRVARWYALGWVILFTVAANVPELGTLRRQILFNEALILLLPLLMIAVYRLPVREALALRPVRPVTWIAVVLAVPAGQLAAQGVLRLAQFVIPVSPETLEQFGRLMMSSEVPTWQLYLLVCVLPGICEELAFRGVLLYGLSRRLRPVTLVLVVAVVFALYHVSLFRLLPTGALGAVLTVIALLTGSVIPCIVAHIANNALALWAGLQEIPLLDVDPWVHVAGAVVLGLCLWILYRTRTPYPGLRPWRAA
jgi:sodium transport system permease protein